MSEKTEIEIALISENINRVMEKVDKIEEDVRSIVLLNHRMDKAEKRIDYAEQRQDIQEGKINRWTGAVAIITLIAVPVVGVIAKNVFAA